MPTVRALRALPPAIAIGSVQGTLALHVDPAPRPPAATRPARGADVVAVDGGVRGKIETWVHRYAQAVVEIVHGDRSVSQLLRWTTPEVYDDLVRRAVLVARAGGYRAGHRPGQPSVRPQVLRVHCCFLDSRVVEASIHVRHGQRSRAIAARFEVLNDRWQCSALEFA